MTTVTPATPTLEPWKRTLRTVIAIVVAVATAVPWIVATITESISPSEGVSVILGQVTLVASAITRFAASDAGNWLFGFIGLDASHVQKLNTDVAQAEQDLEPVIPPVVAAVKTPSVSTAIGAADAVVSGGPAIVSDAQHVASDVQSVGYGQSSNE